MFKINKKICFLFVTLLMSHTAQPLELSKGKAGVISAVTGLATGALMQRLALRLDDGRMPQSVPVAIGALSGLTVGALTYAILYFNFVNEGPCKLCNGRKNSWGHLTGATVKINCGHMFNEQCLDGYMVENGEKCPVCKADVLNKFKVVNYSFTLF